MEFWEQKVKESFLAFCSVQYKFHFIAPTGIIGIAWVCLTSVKHGKISPFLKWIFSTGILTFGKINSYQWALLKPTKNSGSHPHKKYWPHGNAYDSGMFTIISLSISFPSVYFMEEQPKGESASLKMICIYFRSTLFYLFIFPNTTHTYLSHVITGIHRWESFLPLQIRWMQ